MKETAFVLNNVVMARIDPRHSVMTLYRDEFGEDGVFFPARSITVTTKPALDKLCDELKAAGYGTKEDNAHV